MKTEKKQVNKLNILDKLKSRKFHVFVIWAVGFLVAVFSKTLTENVSLEIIKGFSIISAIYIGSNTAQKWIYNKS